MSLVRRREFTLSSQMSRIKSALPWWSKVGAKIVLSRIPLNYAAWNSLGLFKNGPMTDPMYAYRVFNQHLQHYRAGRPNRTKLSMLELGPGDSLFSGVVAASMGFERSYLVDSKPDATLQIEHYSNLTECLRQMGHACDDLSHEQPVLESLRQRGVFYLTNGLASLKTIPSCSVDIIWSHAVLQHIRQAELLPTFKELHRILRPDGVTSHRIDLKDCIARGLNNLRFSTGIWESGFVASSGFYTNRARYSQLIQLFHDAGFELTTTHKDYWDGLPLGRHKMSKEFRNLSDEDLRVCSCDVVLTPVMPLPGRRIAPADALEQDSDPRLGLRTVES